MKYFVVRITYVKPLETVRTITPIHREFLDEGYKKGMLLMSGPLASHEGGIVICRAESQTELEAFFEKDPYKTNGMAIYKFNEFDPVKHAELLDTWIK